VEGGSAICSNKNSAVKESNRTSHEGGMHMIGQQLYRIEEKISPTSTKIKKPLILLPEKRKSLDLKPKSQKN
jgi:hypothetical protein